LEVVKSGSDGVCLASKYAVVEVSEGEFQPLAAVCGFQLRQKRFEGKGKEEGA